jgi:hypothetical protein
LIEHQQFLYSLKLIMLSPVKKEQQQSTAGEASEAFRLLKFSPASSRPCAHNLAATARCPWHVCVVRPTGASSFLITTHTIAKIKA